MKKQVFSLLVVLLFCKTTFAQLNLAIEDRIVAADPAYRIAVEGNGDVAVNSITLAIGLNDGGSAQGGTETATVVGATLDQTLWDQNSAVGTIDTPSLSDLAFAPALPITATVADLFGASSSSFETVVTGSVLLFVDLDLSTKSPGETVAVNPDFAEFSLALGPNSNSVSIASSTVGTLTITVRGDANGDGVVNNLDIGGFILALTNFPAYEAQFPLIDGRSVLDFNGDRLVNNLDIGGFIAALSGN